MDRESLHLWCANPEDVLPDATTEAYASMLSEEERARWQSFRFDSLRREYLTTRALVRSALSYYHPLAPAAWRFHLSNCGKPFIVPDCGLRFNLSNSPGLVVCLISREVEVGVDAEPYKSGGRIAELGPEVFSQLELAQLAVMRDTEIPNRALSLWTLKEAYIKARGMGLTLTLNKISFLYGGLEGIRMELNPRLDDKAGSWRFCLLDLYGCRIAVMTQGAAAFNLQLLEMRPPQGNVSYLTNKPQQWFPRLPDDPVRALEEEL